LPSYFIGIYTYIYSFIRKVVDLAKGGGWGCFMRCVGAWSFFHNFFPRHFYPLPVAAEFINGLIKHVECPAGMFYAF
jgi:hypothetical protein